MTMFSRSLPTSSMDAFAPRDVAAGREVGTGNDLEDLLERSVRLFNQRNGCVDDFAQIVGRNVRRHADGNSAGAVDEKIRNARRQDGGLAFGFVEVRDEIDGFLFYVGEELFGNFGKTS